MKLLVQNKEKTLKTKLKELQQWRRENVYDEAPDQGQDCISPGWLIKENLADNKKIIKARLYAKEDLRLNSSMTAPNK